MTPEELNQLKRTAAYFRSSMIGKNASTSKCLLVNGALEVFLNAKDVKCRLVRGIVNNTFHFWLLLETGLILDATADQFKNPDGSLMPEVYIGNKPEWYEVIKEGVGNEQEK